MKISVVIPSYRCDKSIDELYNRLKSSFEKFSEDFEIILVNDKSPANDWAEIKKLCKIDNRVIGVNLSRNFGQHYAITAGLAQASGDHVVVMDGDLQDQPEEIEKMYNHLVQNDFDVVFGRRINRQDTFSKRLSSILFFKVYNYFTDANFDHTVANFSISKINVIKSVLQFNEHSRTFPLLIKWSGFEIGYINIEHAARKEGNSSYSFRKLLSLAFDVIISQSNKPLKFSIYFGFIMSLVSMCIGLFLVFKKIFLGVSITGWTSLMVSMFFIGGLLFANMGILGLYIGKTYNESKNRPLYIIKEILNKGNERN